MIICFYPIWTCFVDLWLFESWLKINIGLGNMTKYVFDFFFDFFSISAFVIGWPSFRNYFVYYMCRYVSFNSISISGWSSQLLWLASRVYALLPSRTCLNTCSFFFKDKKTRCGLFCYYKQFSVVVSASTIGQSSLSFITVLHMFEQVLFKYQRQWVITSLSLCLKRK